MNIGSYHPYWCLGSLLRQLNSEYDTIFFWEIWRGAETCLSSNLLYPPLQRSWTGVHWFHFVRPSVRMSVHLSLCGQNSVCSVSSTMLAGSISYLYILSSNFRMCVACKYHCKISKKFEICNKLSLVLTWDPIWISTMGNHGAARGILRTQVY